MFVRDFEQRTIHEKTTFGYSARAYAIYQFMNDHEPSLSIPNFSALEAIAADRMLMLSIVDRQGVLPDSTRHYDALKIVAQLLTVEHCNVADTWNGIPNKLREQLNSRAYYSMGPLETDNSWDMRIEKRHELSPALKNHPLMKVLRHVHTRTKVKDRERTP